MLIDPRLREAVEAVPHRFLYATLAGDALCGLAERDAEWDVRACHILPARDLLGLREPPEQVAFTGHCGERAFEFLSLEVRKLFLNLLKKNGQVLEQILSPLVLVTTPEHEELKAIARECACTHMAHHYLSHARLLAQVHAARGDGLSRLRTVRVLLTGIHLMRTGEVETRFQHLDATDPEPLFGELEEAARRSPLPAAPPERSRRRLDDLLVRLRLATPERPAAGEEVDDRLEDERPEDGAKNRRERTEDRDLE